MAVNVKKVVNRAFRKLIDGDANLWLQESFWTIAGDVEFDDGKTAEYKLGQVDRFELRDDGMYIVYKVGADTVAKKLCAYDLIIECLTDLGYPPDGDEEEDIVEAIKRLAEGKFMEGLEQSTGQGNVKIKYTYHKHVTSNGAEYENDNAIYSLTNPGGCYVAVGHTHNKTGICGTTQETYKDQCGCYKTYNADYSDCPYCYHAHGGGGVCEREVEKTRTVYACGNPVNTWMPNCNRNAGKTVDRVEIIYWTPNESDE